MKKLMTTKILFPNEFLVATVTRKGFSALVNKLDVQCKSVASIKRLSAFFTFKSVFAWKKYLINANHPNRETMFHYQCDEINVLSIETVEWILCRKILHKKKVVKFGWKILQNFGKFAKVTTNMRFQSWMDSSMAIKGFFSSEPSLALTTNCVISIINS